MHGDRRAEPDRDRDVEVVVFEPGMAADCTRILTTLPEWFGTSSDEYIREYTRDVAHFPTFVARRRDSIAGFLTLREHYAEAWEIHCLAVERSRHRCGIGRRLVGHAEQWLRSKSVLILHVKTMGPSHPDLYYARTREFYRALGFHRVFETTAVWGPDNPCLVLVKLLSP